MSEVPFLDSSCLGPDLTSLNEDDLLRYFLNDDFEQSPFDSKVPSSSPLLDPPIISLVSPLPRQPQLNPQTTTIQVKKEPTVNIKSSSKTKSKPAASLPVVKSASLPITNGITPVSVPIVTPTQVIGVTTKGFPTNNLSPYPKYCPPKPASPVTTTTQQIHPITVTVNNSNNGTLLDSPLSLHKATFSPISSASPSPLSSPSSSPSPSPVPEDDKTMKRQRRLLKNRESAQLSRIRKKMYIDELERKVSALVTENSGLREEVVHLNDVLKQVTNGSEGESSSKALSRSEIMKAITTPNGSAANHLQAKKYAGVCLLVVLFSLGLFLNVASPSQPRQQINRLIEFDTQHASKNNNNTSSSTNNNVHYRDYKLVKTTDSTPVSFATTGRKHESEEGEKDEQNLASPFHKEMSTKRAWEGAEDDYIFPPSPKRTRNEYHQGDSPMIVEETDDDLFDVLEDDAFSDDGMLTTPSLSPTLSSHSPMSSAPASPVPSSPLFPAVASMPSTPGQPASPSLSPYLSSSHQVGLAVLVPPPVSSESVRMVHIHLWSYLQQQ